MKLIVGLGNPDLCYEKTKHNVGFLILDHLVGKEKFQYIKQYDAMIYKHENIIYCKPMTYMNNSGTAVSKLKNFYKINASDITIIYDDLDMQFVKVRMKHLGSSGGHNGIKSINQFVENEYYKLKIGIKNSNFIEASSFVLSNFSTEEIDQIAKIAAKIKENFSLILSQDIQKFNDVINQKLI